VGKCLILSPDYMWSVDGHLKLCDYGIGIYAYIDGYFYYITSVFVGLSGTWAVTILKKYLDTMERNENIWPSMSQSDCQEFKARGSRNYKNQTTTRNIKYCRQDKRLKIRNDQREQSLMLKLLLVL
jgi:hypothetical protein